MSLFTSPHRRTLGLALTAVATLAGILTVTSPGAQAATAPTPGKTPYVRLFTQVDNPGDVRAVNELTGSALDAKLDELTSWYVHFHAEASNKFPLGREGQGRGSTTLASKLADRGAWVSNYRNGSYVSQSSKSAPANIDEAASLETSAPLSLGTFWGGKWTTDGRMDIKSSSVRLTTGLDAGATTVRVRTASSRPNGSPATWPFVNSRGTGLAAGATSANTRDFVSWIRVDDELMQIVAEPVESGGVVTLTVRRGIWGTGARSHAAEARVYTPVYIGSTAAAKADSNLNGAPIRNDANYPLRYAIKIWQPSATTWIANRIKATFGAPGEGYNTAWLDVSSCWQYNNSDPYGNPVFGWDDRIADQLVRDGWFSAQKAKVAGLRRELPGWNFTANSLLYRDNSCNNDLMADGDGFDGGVLEHWMKTDGEFTVNWPSLSIQNFDIQKYDWPAIYWARWDSASNPESHKRFAYGNLLLAFRTSATEYQFGGPFKLNKPDELFFWDWGTPLANHDAPEQTRVAGTNLYRREFTNGIVLVNPSKAAATLSLGGTYLDVTRKDSSGQPMAVTSITVGANDAAFLLRSDAAPAPTTTTVKSTTTTAAAPATTAGPTTTAAPTPTAPSGPDTVAPKTAISSPVADASVGLQTLTVRGSATDDRALNVVRIGVRDQDNGTWLQPDGTWGPAFVAAAVQSLPADTQADWSWSWTPPRAGNFLLHATAVDTAWNWVGSVATTPVKVTSSSSPTTAAPAPAPTTTVAARTASGPDTVAPRTAIVSPEHNSTVARSTVSVQGTATDDVALNVVRLAVRDQANGTWLQTDGTWAARFAEVAVLNLPEATSATWYWSWTPPRSGTFLLHATAIDTAWNWQGSVATAIVEVS